MSESEKGTDLTDGGDEQSDGEGLLCSSHDDGVN